MKSLRGMSRGAAINGRASAEWPVQQRLSASSAGNRPSRAWLIFVRAPFSETNKAVKTNLAACEIASRKILPSLNEMHRRK